MHMLHWLSGALKLLKLLHLYVLPPRGHHHRRRRTSIRKVSAAMVRCVMRRRRQCGGRHDESAAVSFTTVCRRRRVRGVRSLGVETDLFAILIGGREERAKHTLVAR